MNRFLKQLIYGSIYVLILFGLGLWIYFSSFHSTPTCFDGVKNQNEEGIDCGGSCSEICIPSQSGTIEVVDRVRVLRIDDERLSLLVKIQNNSLDFTAKVFNYTFDVLDPGGKTVMPIFGMSYIYPGEVKYIAAPNLKISPSSAAQATFEIDNPEWILGENLSKPDVTIQNQQSVLEGNEVKVEGSLISHDAVTVKSAEIIAIFYDQFNLPIGVSQTKIENIEPNATRSFVIKHTALGSILTDKTQVFIFAER